MATYNVSLASHINIVVTDARRKDASISNTISLTQTLTPVTLHHPISLSIYPGIIVTTLATRGRTITSALNILSYFAAGVWNRPTVNNYGFALTQFALKNVYRQSLQSNLSINASIRSNSSQVRTQLTITSMFTATK